MKIFREINLYEKNGNRLIKSLELDISVNKLTEILKSNLVDDPNIYKVYKIEHQQFLLLTEYLHELKEINFNKVEVYYECYQE